MDQPLSERDIIESESDERRHLAYVVERIATELSAYGRKVHSRHTEARDLVTNLQENRSDMDHVEKASMRQSVNLMTRVTEHSVAQQRRLSRLAQSPYFGRIDIDAPDEPGVRPVYIGIHSFHDADAELQLIHDWRAPVSSMFYEFELGDAYYDAPSGRRPCRLTRKRQYRIQDRELVFMLETSLNIQDDILQEELSRASDERMKNIVATIQRDQNAIIRNDQTHTLIIQGAAGSGKTSIALHRIAFLLYRYKESIRSQDILIISPNKVFAHYISQVLPELGEEMIQETTMEVLAGTLLGHRVRFQSFAEQVWTLLADDDRGFAERVRFKATGEFLEKISEYARHFRRTNFTPADVTIGPYTLPSDWIAARFRKHSSLPITEQINRVGGEIAEHMKLEYQKTVVGEQRAKVRTQLKAMFTHTTLKAVYKAFYDWLGEPRMLKPRKGGVYEYSDVFPLIYLKQLVDGTFAPPRIKHVVIDEMQDYTPIQYKVIADLYPCKKTILGDYNQSVSPLSASSAEAIRDVLEDSDCTYMHKSYRSTLQITQVAQTIQRNPDLVPIERHGEKPAVIACGDAGDELRRICEMIDSFRASGFNSLGVICKTQEQANRLDVDLGADRKGIHLLDARSTEFTQGVMIATAFLAKGLEFDQVLVPFCNDDLYNSAIDRHMLYIACTRAMHKLTVSHTGELSRFLSSAREQALLVSA